MCGLVRGSRLLRLRVEITAVDEIVAALRDKGYKTRLLSDRAVE
jgi:hypothetical protein